MARDKEIEFQLFNRWKVVFAISRECNYFLDCEIFMKNWSEWLPVGTASLRRDGCTYWHLPMLHMSSLEDTQLLGLIWKEAQKFMNVGVGEGE